MLWGWKQEGQEGWTPTAPQSGQAAERAQPDHWDCCSPGVGQSRALSLSVTSLTRQKHNVFFSQRVETTRLVCGKQPMGDSLIVMVILFDSHGPP